MNINQNHSKNQEEKKNRNDNIKTIAKKSFPLLLVLSIGYGIGFVAYEQSTFGNVKINDISVRGLSCEKAVRKIKDNTNSSSLSVEFSDSLLEPLTEKIKYNEIGAKIDEKKLKKYVEQIKEESDKNYSDTSWFKKLLPGKNYTINYLDFDENELKDYLMSFDSIFYLTTNYPETEKIEYKDKKWQIKEDNKKEENEKRKQSIEKTNYININNLMNEIETAFQNGKDKIIVTTVSNTENSDMKQLVDIANKYCNATIKYRNNISITPQMLLSWLPSDSSNLSDLKDENKITESIQENVKEFIKSEVAPVYSTVGSEREVTTHDGSKINISGGTYGETVDVEKETEEVMKLILKNTHRSRKPVLNNKDTNEDTYIEVDTKKQRIYYVEKGKVIHEMPVILSTTETAKTPTGMYRVEDKATGYTVTQYISTAALKNKGISTDSNRVENQEIESNSKNKRIVSSNISNISNNSSKKLRIYNNRVNYYLSIFPQNISRKIGISDTTDKLILEENTDIQTQEEVEKYYVRFPDGTEQVTESNEAAAELIETTIKTLYESRNNESNENSKEDEENTGNSENNNNIENDGYESFKNNIKNKFSIEARKVLETITTTQPTRKEINKTSTFGNIEGSTEDIQKLYSLVSVGTTVIIH